MHRLPALLFLLVAAVFLPTLFNGFVVYDDIIYIHENPLVSDPHAKAAFLTAWLRPYEQNYAPLLWMSFRLIYGVFETAALAYHLPAILLHAANAVILYYLILQLGGHRLLAFMASALWAIHPQRVEAVSWAASFKDPTSTFFALGFTWLWLQAKQHPARSSWWIASAVVLAVSLLFKQAAMTLPFVLFSYHLLSRKESTPWLIRQNLPLLLLGVAAAVVAAWANHDAFTHTIYLNFQSIQDQAAHALAALGFIVSKTFIPIDLMLDYPVPEDGRIWAVGGFVVLVVWIAMLIRCLLKKHHSGIFCLLWLFATWLPASGVVPTPLEFTADRLTYLPTTMLFAYFALLWRERPPPQAILIGASAVLIPLAILSIQQQTRWRSGESLIAHCLTVNERHYPSILNDVILRLKAGEDPDGPIRALEQAIEHYPHRSAAYHRLVQIHQIKGNQAEVEAWRIRWQENCAYDLISKGNQRSSVP